MATCCSEVISALKSPDGRLPRDHPSSFSSTSARQLFGTQDPGVYSLLFSVAVECATLEFMLPTQVCFVLFCFVLFCFAFRQLIDP